jgi:integrase/recombinase XerD
MKQLPLETESYRILLKDFANWLDILGYADSTLTSLPNHLREFFNYLENHNINTINQSNNNQCRLVKDFTKNA